MSKGFDRSAQDFGNIVNLEHVNVRVADQSQAHLFYVTGMGFTREPYIDFGMRNMWINLGRQQFHLPVGEPQVLRGRIGIVLPSIPELSQRLEGISALLKDTRLSWRVENGSLEVTCPWGNLLQVSEPATSSPMQLGMPFVRFDVPRGSAPGIVRFYEQILCAPAVLVKGNFGPMARVIIGDEQCIEYQETDTGPAAYDGHHIAIYVADFSGPHRRLLERDLISEESNPVQYRFHYLVDPESGQQLFEIEHEVRSLTHPMYGRHLVNRNPAQNNVNYVRGRDTF